MMAAREAMTAGALPRRVTPELLDELPVSDPRAIRSRRDLKLVNRLMGARTMLLRVLDAAASASPMRLVELGAGDGAMMLGLARSRARRWPGVEATLVDLQPSVSDDTLSAIRDFGWSADVVEADALEWLERPEAGGDAIFLANLFVHHFEGDRLARLLGGIAAKARMFVCAEPRRSAVSLVGSHLLGLVGCNDVTRHDAVVSVHAGFRDQELSSAWREVCPPDSAAWKLAETAAGIFSHLFVAMRGR